MSRPLELVTFISPVWYVLMPVAVAGALWARYRPVRGAMRRNLVATAAAIRIHLALAGCAAFVLVSLLSLTYELSLALPLAGATIVVAVALLLRGASGGLHPGLHGLNRPLPVDGLTALDRDPDRVGSARGARMAHGFTSTWRRSPACHHRSADRTQSRPTPTAACGLRPWAVSPTRSISES